MINKLLIILTIFWTSVSSLHAQKIRFGLAIGISEAEARLHYDGTGTPIYDKKGFSDLCGGLVVDFPLIWKFSLQSGVLYLRKGFDGTLSNFGPYDMLMPIHMRLGYLEFPIVIKVNPISNVHIGAGPYFAQQVTKEVIINYDLDWSNKIKTKRLETGYILEGGIEFAFLKKRHSIEVRYGKGITKIYSNYKDRYSNQTLSFLYIFYF